jgi:hypothetical protein
MADVRNEIIDNLQVRSTISGGGFGRLAKAVKVAHLAVTSGAGTLIANSDNVFLNNTSHVLFFRCSAAWSSATKFYLSNRQTSTAVNGSNIVCTSGTLRIEARNTSSGANTSFGSSTQTIPVADNMIAFIAYEMALQTDGSGIVRWYVNGIQLGAEVTITAVQLGYYWQGVVSTYFNRATDGTGVAADFIERGFYNRTLTAAEHLSLYNNGPALADVGASQTATFTGDFSTVDGFVTITGTATVTANVDGVSDGTTSKDNCLRIDKNAVAGLTGAVKTSGTLFTNDRNSWLRASIYVPAGQTYIDGFIITRGSSITAESTIFDGTGMNGTWVDLSGIAKYVSTIGSNTRIYVWALDGSSTTISDSASGELFYITGVSFGFAGCTLQLDAKDAQSDTGQIFDTSGNKNHALLPASGATVLGKPVSEARQVRWTNTWTATHELQYIGGVNQAVLPAKAYIESIVGIVSGATVEDIIIGDGSDTDRYVALTTGLAAGTVTFTLANKTTDGTNLKLTVDPDANATMSIIWTVTYRILE